MRYFQSQLDVEADRLWDVEDTGDRYGGTRNHSLDKKRFTPKA